jgi:CheY-like chemotaxis protein
MALTVVLSVGMDTDLLSSRNLVLQSVGYSVVSAHSIKEAADRFQAADFDLVLLCQTIPTQERDRLTSWIRVSGSRTPVVCVAGRLGPIDAFSGVTVESDPHLLLMGIKEVLTTSAIPAASATAFRDQREAAPDWREMRPGSSGGIEGEIKAGKEPLVARNKPLVPPVHAG